MFGFQIPIKDLGLGWGGVLVLFAPVGSLMQNSPFCMNFQVTLS